MFRFRNALLVSLFVVVVNHPCFAGYVLSVQPVAVYDSRYNGTDDTDGDPVFAATGTYGYMPNVNGAYAPTFPTKTDTIFGQCMIDVQFLPTQTYDSPTYLNMTSATTRSSMLGTNGAPADANLEAFVAGLPAPSATGNAHLMFYVNSQRVDLYGNGMPQQAPTAPQTVNRPLDPGEPSGSASGRAVTPNVDQVAPMRSVISHTNQINAANELGETGWEGTTLPTVLSHELMHNLSLEHLTQPGDSSNLMYSAGGGTGTQYDLTSSQCDDAVVTGLRNGTVAAVPEPSPLLVWSVGLLGTALVRWRSRLPS